MSMMRKDTSIWALVAQVAASVGGDRFQLVDHWDADLFAIGIASAQDDGRLIYISTFKKPLGQLAYECEGRDGRSNLKNEHADLNGLLSALNRHLGVSPLPRDSGVSW